MGRAVYVYKRVRLWPWRQTGPWDGDCRADDCDALDGLYLMVGDSVHDILAGKAAGAITVAIGSHPAALQLADHKIDQLGDLLKLVESF